MHIGLVYPQIEYPTDPAAVRDYAQAAQSLRFTHIQANDHLQGANPAPPRGQPAPTPIATRSWSRSRSLATWPASPAAWAS